MPFNLTRIQRTAPRYNAPAGAENLLWFIYSQRDIFCFVRFLCFYFFCLFATEMASKDAVSRTRTSKRMFALFLPIEEIRLDGRFSSTHTYIYTHMYLFYICYFFKDDCPIARG